MRPAPQLHLGCKCIAAAPPSWPQPPSFHSRWPARWLAIESAIGVQRLDGGTDLRQLLSAAALANARAD